MSRQNRYKARRLRAAKEVDEALVLTRVRRERSVQPGPGSRKLFHLTRAAIFSRNYQLSTTNL